MTETPLRRRVAAATAGVAIAVTSIAAGSAAQAATPSRTAATAVDTTYLADTLGLPSATVVETVTYDRAVRVRDRFRHRRHLRGEGATG